MLRRLVVLWQDDRGMETIEYALIVAVVILPCYMGIRLLWEVLIRFFELVVFVVDAPFF